MEKNKYLAFAEGEDGSDELLIYGDIGASYWYSDGTEASVKNLKSKLDELGGKDVKVRINSYGGEVAEGLAIYNVLKDYSGQVETVVDGFACSAASIIFMAGARRVVPESALLMIHKAAMGAFGNSDDFEKAAEDLKQIEQPLVNIYVSGTGLPENEIRDMMAKETWITSSEAVDMGFATHATSAGAVASLEQNYLHKSIMRMKEMEARMTASKEAPGEPTPAPDEPEPTNMTNEPRDEMKAFFGF